MISTKKGRTGEFKFNFNSRTSFYTPTSFVNVLSSNEMRSVVNATGNLEWIGRLGEAKGTYIDIYDHLLTCMDRKWPYNGIWQYMAVCGHICIIYGHVLTIYGHLWTCLAHTWPICGHI